MNLQINPVDGAILLAYMLGTVGLGTWLGRGQRDVSGYLLGGRDLPWWGILLSIVATETSTVTFLSVPGLAYAPGGGNLLFLQLTLGYIVGRLIVVWLLLPHYFRGEMFTAYEVLHRRFGGLTKQTASLLFLVTRNLSDGLRLYLTALVVEQLLGLDLWLSIAVMGVVTILYTVFGGMRSVVWTDCIQFAIYMAGALLAAWVIVGRLPGGWEQYADFARTHDKLRLLDFTPDVTRPYTFWSGLLGGTFVALATHGTDQLMVQRYLAARSPRGAAWALGLSGVVVCLQFAVFLLVGVGLACFFESFGAAGARPASDQAFATFIVKYLPTGVRGITLAAIFAAAMSTLSSSLNSSATAAVNDLYLSWRRAPVSARYLLWLSRMLTVAFGLLQIGVAMAGRHLQSSVVESVMQIASFTLGVILGVFFLGVLTRRTSQRDALWGLLGGLAVMTWIARFSSVAWPWYSVVGSLSTVVIGLLTSLIPRQQVPNETK